tara:strand:+ start:13116 stop:13262 length:147 start_codon:yes stop_codon:yes gene_type:complete
MEVIMLIGAGFVAGMYFSTQIGDWIDGRTGGTNKKLLENIKKIEKKSK